VPGLPSYSTEAPRACSLQPPTAPTSCAARAAKARDAALLPSQKHWHHKRAAKKPRLQTERDDRDRCCGHQHASSGSRQGSKDCISATRLCRQWRTQRSSVGRREGCGDVSGSYRHWGIIALASRPSALAILYYTAPCFRAPALTNVTPCLGALAARAAQERQTAVDQHQRVSHLGV
jgi:hypothetical protein